MLKHEYFEELSAAASVGQATAGELAELERHASECFSCRQAYLDYLSIAAHEFEVAQKEPVLSPREARECLDSELFTRRFFDRAEREGIVFSDQVAPEMGRDPAPPLSFSPRFGNYFHPSLIAAAALLIILALSSTYLYRRSLLREIRPALEAQTATRPMASDLEVSTVRRVSELAAANQNLRVEISRLSKQLTDANNQTAASASEQRSISQDRKRLLSLREALESKLQEAQRDLGRSQSMLASAQHEAEAQRSHVGDLEANLVASQTELTDLTEKLKDASVALDRERQLLAMGHDVSDLMGARNLHILDVVDTDPHGKTRPAFGRIFFTEGKSLVFYAYDLNEGKMQKANYQYQVWAKKEGQNRPVRKLGIFYSDDKSQHRWVFKCDDAKVLREIDSVFVTLGRPDSDPSHPEGSRLMHAYLRGTPNHP